MLGYVLATVLGQVQGKRTETTLLEISNSLFPAAQAMQEAESTFQRVTKAYSDSVVTQDSGSLAVAREDGARMVQGLNRIAGSGGIDSARAASAKELAASTDRFLSDATNIYSQVISNPAAMTADMQDKMRDLASRTNAIRAALAETRKASAQDLLNRLNDLETRSASGRATAMAVFGVTLLVSFLIVQLTIRKSITGPITRVIEGVGKAVASAGAASRQMADAGQSTARNSHEQAASIQEASAFLELISTSTRANADHAMEADRLMRESRQTMEKASQSMAELKVSMDDISQSSRQVSAVLKSIDEIAFHTNILALNAAVEAARAGAAGSGFSVVADEVRTLARRAADAAAHSSEIIEKTMSAVISGVQLVNQSSAAFEAVSTRIVSCSEMATQIAASTDEQAKGIAQAGNSVVQIERGTQKNAESAEQTARTATQLQDQVHLTQRFIDELVGVMGFRVSSAN